MIDSEPTWHQKVAALAIELGRTPTLAELLPLATKHNMSPEELRAQRDSYVRAEMGFGSDADEAAYRAALFAGDKAELDRLEAASQARMAAYDRIKGK